MYDFISWFSFQFSFIFFSVATLPITIRCVEENNGINSRISRYMLPLGATVNMDGSALNRPVVIIFVAQLNDVDMSPEKIVTVW